MELADLHMVNNYQRISSGIGSRYPKLLVFIIAALLACAPGGPAQVVPPPLDPDFAGRVLGQAFERFPGLGITILQSRPGVDTILVLVVDDSAMVAADSVQRAAHARQIVCEMARLAPPAETRVLGAGFRIPGGAPLRRVNTTFLRPGDLGGKTWDDAASSPACHESQQ